MKKSNFEEVSFFRYRYIQQTAIHYSLLCWRHCHVIFQQDSAPAHRAQETVALYFLERHRITYHHGYGRRTALIWIWLTITCGAYWRGECIAHTFLTSVTARHVWLKSGRSLTRRSLTGRSASGVYVWGHAFNKKEDTLGTGCETVDKTVCHWPLITCNVNFHFSAMHFRC